MNRIRIECIYQGRYNDECEPTEAESSLARRRIVSAVCAFGGTFIVSCMHNNHAPDPFDIGSNNSVVPSSTTSSKKAIYFPCKGSQTCHGNSLIIGCFVFGSGGHDHDSNYEDVSGTSEV
mmetsp:Transcript_61019/g.68320  ORF Transcript_61019/g.68320 Transcript_61019/m.68320 type:complete len:120 (-) Transcript_61019:202-561(-)